ncbi:MAG TPA: hypothetical protein PLH43_13275 [Acetivibrio sp.]|uniref:hypothetical protein n=1 Tax=Acetivibrio sp. TaxID=1872092 RepID=UPI002C7873BB|nr:hypothetical protein [Acetivibrio sp.]HOM03771.1 hypothetical protein [Acetivibrio sp.]HPP93725.1 hypothetical protein [Bacteroidales bacterium]
MGDKLFKTYREQIEILRSRGLKVDEGAIGVLQTENYYNVINGYKDLFLEIASPEERNLRMVPTLMKSMHFMSLIGNCVLYF